MFDSKETNRFESKFEIQMVYDCPHCGRQFVEIFGYVKTTDEIGTVVRSV